MTKSDSSRIQSTQVLSNLNIGPGSYLTYSIQAKHGHDTGAGTFAARSQSAADKSAHQSAATAQTDKNAGKSGK
jgi:hypothetical protein